MNEEEQLQLIKIGILLGQDGLSLDIHSLSEIEGYVENRYGLIIVRGNSIDLVYESLLKVVPHE